MDRKISITKRDRNQEGLSVCVFVHLVQQEGQWAVDYSRVWTPQSTKFWKRGITSHNELAETTTVNLNTGTTTANTPLAENQSSLANT